MATQEALGVWAVATVGCQLCVARKGRKGKGFCFLFYLFFFKLSSAVLLSFLIPTRERRLSALFSDRAWGTREANPARRARSVRLPPAPPTLVSESDFCPPCSASGSRRSGPPMSGNSRVAGASILRETYLRPSRVRTDGKFWRCLCCCLPVDFCSGITPEPVNT